MNGIHDLGGMHGFGPVGPEPDEPVFHVGWERRAFALTLAMGAWGRWNIDMSRDAREKMPPAEYLSTTYYEHWLFGLERLMVEHGFLTPGELDRGHSDPGDGGGVLELRPGALTAGEVERFLHGRGARREGAAPARFERGDAVMARSHNPAGHTRLPRYVRGRRGVVDRDHGVFVFPDTHAMGLGACPQHVYSVHFTARDLWGSEASPRDCVHVDLWDEYLDPA